MTTVSVIILTWNSVAVIEAAIRSVLAQDYEAFELIIVDNASSDGTLRLVLSRFAGQCRCIGNPENLGFCGGYNAAFGLAKGELVLVLNPDVVLEPDFVSAIVPVFEDPRVGMASGRLMRPDGTTVDSTGQFLSRSRRTIDRGANRVFDVSEHSSPGILSACGAVAMYRMTMIKDVSDQGRFFDEDYFAFHEDLEVGIRAWRAGWLARYEDRARAIHLRSTGRKRRWGSLMFSHPTPLLVHIVRNRYLTVLRHDTLNSLIVDLIPIVTCGLATVATLAVRRPAALWSLLWSGRQIRNQLHKRILDRQREGMWGPWSRRMPPRGCWNLVNDSLGDQHEEGEST